MRTRQTTALAAVAAATLLLTACGQSETRDESGEITTGGDTDVFTLQVGDCLGAIETGEVNDVPTVPCSEPHQLEVFGEYSFPDGDYPGDDTISTTADEECIALFDAFVGLAYEESALGVTYYTPTQESWESGDDRLVSCLVGDPAQDVTGSLEGAAY